MKWIKKLFSPKKDSFKKEFELLIPKVKRMIEAEQVHLKWLIKNDADEESIKRSKYYLNHFKQRYKEYNDYVSKY